MQAQPSAQEAGPSDPKEPSTQQLLKEKQSVKDALEGFAASANKTWETAYKHFTTQLNTRNKRALVAAKDHRKRAEQALSIWLRVGATAELQDYLVECRDHAEDWEAKWREWGPKKTNSKGFKCGYAAHVHGEAAKEYRKLLSILGQVSVELKPQPGNTQLVPLFCTTGGGQQAEITQTLKISVGVESTLQLSDSQMSKVLQEATVAVEAYGAKLGAKMGAEVAHQVQVASANKRAQVTDRSIVVSMNAGQPCYIYQPKTVVLLDLDGKATSHSVTLWGGYIFSHKPLTAAEPEPAAGNSSRAVLRKLVIWAPACILTLTLVCLGRRL